MVYALLFATTVSVTHGQLTRADTISAVTAVASIASFTLSVNPLFLERGTLVPLHSSAEADSQLTPAYLLQTRPYSVVALTSLLLEAILIAQSKQEMSERGLLRGTQAQSEY